MLDDDSGAPWAERDGHGSIRTVRDRAEKRAGEVLIYSGNRAYWLYDFAGAVKTARADSWGSKNCRPGMTPGQRAAQAARDDMAYCRRWLTGDLFYVGVSVRQLDADGAPLDALWGVEYGYNQADQRYAADVALELIGELEYMAGKAAQAAAREAEERAHWAARDVLTA